MIAGWAYDGIDGGFGPRSSFCKVIAGIGAEMKAEGRNIDEMTDMHRLKRHGMLPVLRTTVSQIYCGFLFGGSLGSSCFGLQS